MKVLLSIKPEFADKIFDGKKKFEFRRAIFKRNDIKTVVVYASSPVQKVIGEFEIESIIKGNLVELWETTKAYAGIDEQYFYKYFADRNSGFAIKIKQAKKYKLPLSLKENFNVVPPQSFVYL
ncbi:ASCH domain-containing protein [Filimonas effusa]|uniref:ASCH domain-containing protein n=1 Tax=Filimonas effusa TaxID=2508721 RepID=A0A4V1MAB7_9BACT|nr:ASCH domain-containing protein [Filimonas effusa]RXK85316.1 ASCH domain-containing protein [Filimonas effusa]